MNVQNKTIWIIGAARSGIAAARILHQHGANVFVSDSGQIEPSIKETLSSLTIEFEENGHSLERLLHAADLVVLSPSVPLNWPLPIAIRRAGIPLVSEIEVGSWFVPAGASLIGITGTNGKSTTTHYCAQLFALGQRNSVACGNYGRALCDALLAPEKFNSFIVELSSYQLETTYSLRPHATVLLNLQNDHQARYGNMDEYLKAKWRLVLMTKPEGIAVIDAPLLKMAVEKGLALPECRIAVSYGFLAEDEIPLVMESAISSRKTDNLGLPLPPSSLPIASYGSLGKEAFEVMLRGRKLTHIWMEKDSNPTGGLNVCLVSSHESDWNQNWHIPQSVLPGDHNQINILAASLPALDQGIQTNVIRSQWNAKTSGYEHLAHRLEVIGRDKKFLSSEGISIEVRIINDSKATNVESTLVAIKSFPGNIRLLLGGEPKGDSYTLLAEFLNQEVVKIYPFGRAASLIREQLAAQGEWLAPSSSSMTQAAQLALDESQDGDVLLLSPACASFDEFRNFEHRGDVFRKWALDRISTN